MALATASLIHPDRGLQSGRVFPRIFLGEKEMQKTKMLLGSLKLCKPLFLSFIVATWNGGKGNQRSPWYLNECRGPKLASCKVLWYTHDMVFLRGASVFFSQDSRWNRSPFSKGQNNSLQINIYITPSVLPSLRACVKSPEQLHFGGSCPQISYHSTRTGSLDPVSHQQTTDPNNHLRWLK